MRTLLCTLVILASTANASPWQKKCSATLDAARKSAAKIDPALAKVAVVAEELGSEEQVKLKLGTAPSSVPSVISAGKVAGEARDWESTDETTSTGEYHYVASRGFATGHVLIMLTMWKKPVAHQLADVFRAALEACFADK